MFIDFEENSLRIFGKKLGAFLNKKGPFTFYLFLYYFKIGCHA